MKREWFDEFVNRVIGFVIGVALLGIILCIFIILSYEPALPRIATPTPRIPYISPPPTRTPTATTPATDTPIAPATPNPTQQITTTKQPDSSPSVTPPPSPSLTPTSTRTPLPTPTPVRVLVVKNVNIRIRDACESGDVIELLPPGRYDILSYYGMYDNAICVQVGTGWFFFVENGKGETFIEVGGELIAD